MAVIEVAKVPKKEPKGDEALRLVATLCYYYPQYSFAEARQLPYKRLVLLLQEATKQKAIEWHWQTLIAASAQVPKGKGTKRLLKMLQGYIE